MQLEARGINDRRGSVILFMIIANEIDITGHCASSNNVVVLLLDRFSEKPSERGGNSLARCREKKCSPDMYVLRFK